MSDDFRTQPMRGDLALVVGLQHQTELNGKTVKVLSDPFESRAIHTALATVTEPLILSRVDLGNSSNAWDGCIGDVIATKNLIRIRPTGEDGGVKTEKREPVVTSE